jgi:hypothetical protein
MSRAEAWIARLTALSRMIQEVDSELEEISVERHLAVMERNERARVQCDVRIKRLDLRLSSLLATGYDWTGAADFEYLRTLLVDLQVRVSLAVELFEAWRKYLAFMEMADALGQYPADAPREVCEETAARLESEWRLQMGLLERLLPAESGKDSGSAT